MSISDFSISLILTDTNFGKKNELIPILIEVQKIFGYISFEHASTIANHLSVTLSKIYSVASFYDNFTFAPSTKNTIRFCKGLTCYIKGSSDNKAETDKFLKTTGKSNREMLDIKTEFIPCKGICQHAPLVEFSGEQIHVENFEKLLKKLNK